MYLISCIWILHVDSMPPVKYHMKQDFIHSKTPIIVKNPFSHKTTVKIKYNNFFFGIIIITISSHTCACVYCTYNIRINVLP